VAGNQALYRSLLLDLANAHQATLQALQLAVSQGQAEVVRHLSHSLRGEAGNLGLRVVSQQAALVETWARQGQLGRCGQDLSALCESLCAVSVNITVALGAARV
jgi:HPt (histidine-containing phosphotransfer) domain-containing protein